MAAIIPTPAATPTSAIRLCPHACPIPGRASYSLITHILGLTSAPYVALKAVSNLYDRSTYENLNKSNAIGTFIQECHLFRIL